MSSEDSDTGTDGQRTLRRKSLPWLKRKYRKSLRELDQLHYDTLSVKSKQMLYSRVNSISTSEREYPQDIPEYLLVQGENET